MPKKDDRVRWISDFRALNKANIRKVYPIPRIQDILNRRPGYNFLTKINISMQYYTFLILMNTVANCVQLLLLLDYIVMPAYQWE